MRVAARNKKVATALAMNYRVDTRDETRLPIFCISNKAYMHHLRGYETDDPPALSLTGTQVPIMRAHTYAVPSRGKFAVLDHHSSLSIPTLFNIMQMSCSTTTIARRDHLVGVVDQAQKVRTVLVGMDSRADIISIGYRGKHPEAQRCLQSD